MGIKINKVIVIIVWLMVLNLTVYSQPADIDSLKERLSSSVSGSEKTDILLKLSKIYIYSNIDSSLIFTEKALDLARKNKDHEKEANALYLKGGAYWLEGNTDEAYKIWSDALKICEKYNIQKWQPRIYMGMADIYTKFKDYNTALEHLNRAVEISESIKDSVVQIRVAHDIANVYRLSGNYEEAEIRYNRLLKRLKKGNDYKMHASIYNNLGVIYTYTNQPDLAIEHYLRSNELFNKAGIIVGVMNTFNNLSEMYYRKGAYEKSYEYARKALDMNPDYQYQEMARSSFKNMALFYAAKDSVNAALRYIDKMSAFHDSTISREYASKIANLKVKNETEKKQLRIEQLSREKEIKSRWLILSISGIIVLMTLLVIVVRQYKHKNIAYKILLEKNLQIVKLSKVAQEQMKEKLAEADTVQPSAVPEEGIKPGKKDNHKDIYPISKDLRFSLVKSVHKKLVDEEIYLQGDITIEKLAISLNTNSKYISRIIKEEYGTSFTSIINEMRINKIQEMMLDSKYGHLTLEALAYEVGFNTISSFNRVFKSITGLSPSQYKNLYHERVKG